MGKQKCSFGVEWVRCDKLEWKFTPHRCKNTAKKGGMCKKHFKETGGIRLPKLGEYRPVYRRVNNA